MIFTIPHELLGLWQANRKRLSDHLFRASRDTLFELLDDERYLGARPGLLAAVHTWGRTLTLHPHAHCLVTGGGRAPDGSWRAVRGGFLLPVRVVRVLFRGKLLAWLRSDLENDRLVLPDGVSKAEFERSLRRLYSKTWNVRLQQRYAHGHGVVAYLARYVRGGPIRDRRLVSATPTTTTFSYTDHRDGKTKRMALPAEEFLRRLFWHVPEPRSHGVRLYRLYGRRQQALCEACRAILPPPVSEAARRGSEDAEHPRAQGRRCSICGEPLASIADVLPERPDSHRILLPQRLKSP